jgi:hypothetical protein
MNSPPKGRPLPAIGPPGSESHSSAGLGADVKAKIGLRLRSMYGELVEQEYQPALRKSSAALMTKPLGEPNER